jgi:hypothetical protein
MANNICQALATGPGARVRMGLEREGRGLGRGWHNHPIRRVGPPGASGGEGLEPRGGGTAV